MSDQSTKTVQIELYGENHQLEVQADETVLDAALRQDVDLPYSCMSGSCNACQCKLKSGKITMDICDALSEEEVAAGEVLSCQARPQTEDVALIFED